MPKSLKVTVPTCAGAIPSLSRDHMLHAPLHGYLSVPTTNPHPAFALKYAHFKCSLAKMPLCTTACATFKMGSHNTVFRPNFTCDFLLGRVSTSLHFLGTVVMYSAPKSAASWLSLMFVYFFFLLLLLFVGWQTTHCLIAATSWYVCCAQFTLVGLTVCDPSSEVGVKFVTPIVIKICWSQSVSVSSCSFQNLFRLGKSCSVSPA